MNESGILEIVEFFIVSFVTIGIVSQIILPFWDNFIVPNSPSGFQSNLGIALIFLFGLPTFVGIYLISTKLKDYYRSNNQF